jgi:Xaa-Pro dipeptidase
VQTLQPTLRLGRDVWDRTAMPIAEFISRADVLRAAMADAGLDALLLYGRGLNECGHPTYLANYIVKLPFSALVVLPRDGEPALIFEGATRGRDAAKATTWIDDVRPCWNIAEACVSVLEERGLTNQRLGLAGMPRLVPYDEWRQLVVGLGRAALVDAEAIVDRQRAIKSPREVAQMRRASELAMAAARRLSDVRAGRITESDLAAEIMRDARRAGAEDIRLMIARPAETHWAFRPPEEHRLDEDTTFVLHLAVSWERYWGEVTRTFHVRANTIEPAWTDHLEQRYRQLAAACRPGIVVRDAVARARAVLTPDEWQALETCGLGHGIGVTPEETPSLSGGCNDMLQPGMCLVIRSAMRTDGRLVVHGETTIL